MDTEERAKYLFFAKLALQVQRYRGLSISFESEIRNRFAGFHEMPRSNGRRVKWWGKASPMWSISLYFGWVSEATPKRLECWKSRGKTRQSDQCSRREKIQREYRERIFWRMHRICTISWWTCAAEDQSITSWKDCLVFVEVRILTFKLFAKLIPRRKGSYLMRAVEYMPSDQLLRAQLGETELEMKCSCSAQNISNAFLAAESIAKTLPAT